MASLRPTTEGQPSIQQTDKAFGGEGCLFAESGWGDSTLSTKNEGGAITGGARHKILEYMVQRTVRSIIFSWRTPGVQDQVMRPGKTEVLWALQAFYLR